MTKKKTSNVIIFCILCLLVVAFLTPIFFVLINSFKGKLFISNNPFALPTAETFVGLTNYVNGIEKTGFFTAFGWYETEAVVCTGCSRKSIIAYS